MLSLERLEELENPIELRRSLWGVTLRSQSIGALRKESEVQFEEESQVAVLPEQEIESAPW